MVRRVGPPGRVRPKSTLLVLLLIGHRPALAYDWRTRFGLSLDAITDTVGWGEAWDLTSEILRDPHSHTVASVAGWSYVPGPAQVAVTDAFEAWVNASRARNTVRWTAPRPWITSPTTPAAPAREPTADDHRQRAAIAAWLNPPTP